MGHFPEESVVGQIPNGFPHSTNACCWDKYHLANFLFICFYFLQEFESNLCQEQDLSCSQKMTVLQLFYTSEIKGEYKKDYMRM